MKRVETIVVNLSSRKLVVSVMLIALAFGVYGAGVPARAVAQTNSATQAEPQLLSVANAQADFDLMRRALEQGRERIAEARGEAVGEGVVLGDVDPDPRGPGLVEELEERRAGSFLVGHDLVEEPALLEIRGVERRDERRARGRGHEKEGAPREVEVQEIAERRIGPLRRFPDHGEPGVEPAFGEEGLCLSELLRPEVAHRCRGGGCHAPTIARRGSRGKGGPRDQGTA